MSRPLSVLYLAVLFSTFGLLPASADDPVPGELLVGLPLGAAIQSSRAQIETAAGPVIGASGQLGIVRIRLKAGLTQPEAIRRLRATGAVRFVEPNYVRKTTATPNDTYWGNQYGPQLVQADKAWDIWQPTGQVVVAIVDTGVDGSHPDLSNKMYRVGGVIQGYNAQTGLTGTAADDHGHGTHCTGIAAAEINNSTGIAGMAGWNPAVAGSSTSWVKIMPVKVLDASGSGTDAQVADGITWATDHGAKIVSLSLGGPDYSATLSAACQYAWSRGVVVVAAAGNSASSALFYPAAYANVVSVAAVDSTNTLANYSNWGSWVTMAAPGSNIISTTPTYPVTSFPSNYAWANGTSMACPHVAGAAALLLAQNPSATNAQLVTALTTTTDAYNTLPGESPSSANGRLNAYRALQAIGSGGVPAPPGNVVVGGGNMRIGLRWDADSGAASYNIKRSTTSGGPYTTVANVSALQYIDTGLTNGTPYCYVITAVNSSGESANSAQVSATPTAAVRVNAGGPDYVSGSIGLLSADTMYSGGATYQYSIRPIANTSDPQIYTAVRYTSTSFAYNLAAPQGSYTLKLHFCECYHTQAGMRVFNVTAGGVPVLTNFDIVADAGPNTADVKSFPVSVGISGVLNVTFTSVYQGALACAVELVPALPTVPPAPTGLTAAPGNGSVGLSWTAAPTATSYNVKRALVSGGPYTNIATGVTAISYTDSAVTNGTTYYYVVNGVNNVGEGANSNEASATPSSATTLRINAGGPTYVSATMGTFQADSYYSGGAQYTYSARTISNTSDPQLYLAVRYTGDTFAYNLPAVPGTYTLKLHFCECYHTQPGMRVFNVTANGAALLTNFDIVADVGPNVADIKSFPVTVGSNGVLNVTFTSVYQGALVCALELVPAQPTPPPAPTGLTAAPGNNAVMLSWTAAATATSYNVKRSTTSGGPYATIASGVTTTSYTDSTAVNGTTYYYVVSGVNGVGEGANSNQASATPSSATTLRINCGGPAYTSSTLGAFQADAYFSSGATYTYSTRDILNTVDDPLYLTVRYTSSNFAYNLPAVPGNYTLKLHFAECYHTQPGMRVFNVAVNGTAVLTNFDIVADVGPNTADIKSFPVTVGANGILNVAFSSVYQGALVCAIELVPR